MSFRWNGRLTDVKPSIVIGLPEVTKANCDCSFCWLVFYIGTKDLTESDKKIYREHLRQAHGLTEDPIP